MSGIFDLSLKISGYPLKKAKKKASEILKIPEIEYADFVGRQQRKIADYHLKNNTFYREICGFDRFESWNDLPVMKKADYQRPLPERISDGFSKKDIYINKTSGSGGYPMVFAKDKFCHALVWANTIRRFGW